MKRIAAAFLVLFCVSAAGAQGLLPKPTAEITKFQVEAISLRDITFLFELSVKNPYPLALSFKGMNLDFSVEGSTVFTAASQGGFSVPAKGSKANPFTVTLAYADIIKVVKDYSSKDWLNTAIKGTLVIPLPAIPGLPKDISFTFDLAKKIPAIKPSVAVTGFTVAAPSAADIGKAALKAGKKVDPEKARGVFTDLFAGKKPSAASASSLIDPSEIDVPLSVAFTIEVGNDARAPLSFTSLGYELSVNGEPLVSGESTEVRQAGTKTLVTVTSVFSSKKLSKGVKAIFSDRTGTFNVIGKASLKLPAEIRKDPVPLSFSESGSFSLK